MHTERRRPVTTARVIRVPLVAAIASLVVVAIATAATPVVASAASATAATAPQVIAGLRPGMTVMRDGVGAVVPAAGTAVQGEAVMADGSTRTITVRALADGRVLVSSAARAAGRASSLPGPAAVFPSSSPSACSDRAYKLNSSWWHSTYRWWFRATTTPSYMTRAAATNALKRAVGNITHERNNCGRADHVSATGSYLGTTSATVDISANSVCTTPDGKNVVGFGDLASGFVGYSCWWFTGNVNTEADMKLNKADFRWTTTLTGCSNAFMVEAVATHEFGHVFGLGHVSEASHANLTMSTDIDPCDNSASTLGLGDMLGLEVRY